MIGNVDPGIPELHLSHLPTSQGYCEEQMKTRYLWKSFMNMKQSDILKYSYAFHPLGLAAASLPQWPLISELEPPLRMPPSAPQLTSPLDIQVKGICHFPGEGGPDSPRHSVLPTFTSFAFLSEMVVCICWLVTFPPQGTSAPGAQDLVCLVHSYIPCV